MPDISLTELLLIVTVAMIFVKPQDVPVILRACARAWASVKRLMDEIRATFDEVVKESGVDGVKQEFRRETRMIEGDDGDMYEAYDLTALLPQPEPAEKKERE